jgi:hypothetical protein
LDGKLVFFLKSRQPVSFPRDEKVEVAAEDGSFHTTLSLNDGSLMLEDANTALGSVEPLTRFGASAFGPLRARVVSSTGVTGDWLPLGTLVRLPGFQELRCPRNAQKPCALSGANLFLIQSVASSPDFNNAMQIPPEFTGTQLTVPHPSGGNLYLRLRDDPATVQTLTLPVIPMPGAAPSTTAAQTQPPADKTQAPVPNPNPDKDKPASPDAPNPPPANNTAPAPPPSGSTPTPPASGNPPGDPPGTAPGNTPTPPAAGTAPAQPQ